MKALLKIVLGFVFLVVLLAGGAVALLLTVDPNAYKPQISSAVKEATGRDFTINGDINVMFYPVLGFKVAGLEMGNPSGFSEKEFIKAGEVQAGVKILPLIDKKIEVTTVSLIEPQITVIKTADGKNNLEMPKGEAAEASKVSSGSEKLDISFEGLEIKKGKVTYIDKTTGKTTTINPLNLNIPSYASGREIEVAADMMIQNPAPAKPMSFDVSTTIKPDLSKNELTFRNLKAHVDLGGAKASATAGVVVNTKSETITISNLETGWQGTSVKGNATVKGFKQPSVTFDISSPSVDLDALLPKDQGQAKDNDKALLPVEMLRTLTLDGKVAIGTLKASGLSMSDFKVDVSARDGVLKASPLTLNMYDGTLNTDIQIDARNASPSFTLKGGLKSMEVGKLLTAKMGQDYLTGVANVTFDLNARGNSMNALNRSAGGQLQFDFGKGYINKWQLSRLMNQAIAYFETGKLDQNASDKIYFTSLDAVFTGQGGVFKNSDLVLIGPKSHALGSGSVNLAAQSVDYTVRVGGGDNPEKFAKKSHLPVRMTGPFSKPAYSIDMQALMQDAVGQKIEEKIEEKKEELFQDLFKKLDKKSKKADPAPESVPESVPEAVAPSSGEAAVPAPVAPAVVEAPAAEAVAPAETPVAAESAPAAVETAPEPAPSAPESVPDAAPEVTAPVEAAPATEAPAGQ
jgi:AsmA protein